MCCGRYQSVKFSLITQVELVSFEILWLLNWSLRTRTVHWNTFTRDEGIEMNTPIIQKAKMFTIVSIIFVTGSLRPCLCADDKNGDAGVIARQTLMKWEEALQKLEVSFGLTSDEYAVIVSVPEQELRLVKGKETVRLYMISTSKKGTGNRAGSNKTPLGTHCIAQKIGHGAQFGSIFHSRRNTRRIAQIHREKTDSRKDLKTTRILRLEGAEPGINKGDGIDTYDRYIYIHGTPEEGLIGTPASNGCIRMKNGDVMEFFDLVNEGTLVEIYN
jgi:hypothetical protein